MRPSCFLFFPSQSCKSLRIPGSAAASPQSFFFFFLTGHCHASSCFGEPWSQLPFCLASCLPFCSATRLSFCLVIPNDVDWYSDSGLCHNHMIEKCTLPVGPYCNHVIEKCTLPVGMYRYRVIERLLATSWNMPLSRDRKNACILWGRSEFRDLCFVRFRGPYRVPVTPDHLVMHRIVAVMNILYVHSDILLIPILACVAPLSIMAGHPFYPRF